MSSNVGSKLFPALIGALAACVVFAALAVAGAFDTSEDTSPASSGRDPVRTQPAATPSGGLDVAGLYESTRSGVVFVEARGQGPGGSSGSGFLVDDQGSIVTNQHVVDNAEEVDVRFGEGGDPVDARVTGSDASTDLALLKIDPSDVDGEPLRLGSSDQVRVGEPVIAIGSPFGKQTSLSVGVVSATGRSIDSLTSGFAVANVIQIDAPINRGNSGGPLFDGEGRVIGINAQIQSTTGTAEGVGFAIPIDIARRSLDQLVRTGRVRYAYIGIRTQDVTPGIAGAFDLGAERGALVTHVEQGTPAARAGLRGGSRTETHNGIDVTLGGDLIVAIAGTPVTGADDISRVVTRLRPGQTVEVTVIRGGRRTAVDVTLGDRPLTTR